MEKEGGSELALMLHFAVQAFPFGTGRQAGQAGTSTRAVRRSNESWLRVAFITNRSFEPRLASREERRAEAPRGGRGVFLAERARREFPTNSEREK